MWLYRYAYSACSAFRPIPIAKVKTLTGGLRLGFDHEQSRPSDLMVSACRGPAMDYIYRLWCCMIAQAVFLLERGQTDKHTDKQTRLKALPKPSAIQPAWVTNGVSLI